MCHSPAKRALKAQRKLDRAQRRMDSKAAKYGPSCQPFARSYNTNTNAANNYAANNYAANNYAANNYAANNLPTTFDPASAMSALRIQSREQGQEQARALLPVDSNRAVSNSPPSYGAVMGSEYDSPSTPYTDEKSGLTGTHAMAYTSTEPAYSAGSSSQGMGSRALVGASGHMRRGGCGGLLVRLVKGAYEANKERKAARQGAEMRERGC